MGIIATTTPTPGISIISAVTEKHYWIGGFSLADAGDILITGGQAFGIISEQVYFTGFYGEPWGEELRE